jgi:hypothetical protein
VELKYFEYLVDFTVSTEQWLLLNELGENAADCPDVHSETILALTKQHFWGSVPEGFYLVGKGLDGDAKGAGKSEIGNF